MKKSLTFLFVLCLFTAQAQSDKTAMLEIQTTSVCGMCEETIETEMLYEKGVKAVDLDLSTSIITVNYDPRKTDADKLRTAVTKLGYGADGVAADPEAFSKLPACCQKEGCGQMKKE